jgi:hypothetical protein
MALHYVDPGAPRDMRCFTCGNPTHRKQACDCAFTANAAAAGIAGDFSIQAFVDVCVRPFDTRADSKAELAQRLEWYRKTKSYQAGKVEFVVGAADRWAKCSAQIQDAYEAAVKARNFQL